MKQCIQTTAKRAMKANENCQQASNQVVVSDSHLSSCGITPHGAATPLGGNTAKMHAPTSLAGSYDTSVWGKQSLPSAPLMMSLGSDSETKRNRLSSCPSTASFHPSFITFILRNGHEYTTASYYEVVGVSCDGLDLERKIVGIDLILLVKLTNSISECCGMIKKNKRITPELKECNVKRNSLTTQEKISSNWLTTVKIGIPHSIMRNEGVCGEEE
ncbi:hypothetical protein WN51_13309 [Melipona quadrifasciata]|uniref:Uncharacterized protein n=1 Tax=Melipona quadrifasciata TaxID=166423 RepID=A0A0N0BGT2_9HYME|nr:hypothetical protein WN51_13309 [Melipona quadrifasciata]